MTDFAIVGEADADTRIGRDLADRVLIDSIEWLEPELIPSIRNWIETIADDSHPCSLHWSRIAELARRRGINPRGHINGQPLLPDARQARRVLVLFRQLLPDLEAVVLMRDADKCIDRRRGIEQVRNANPGKPAIVIGVADPEREAWVIAGFDPGDDEERQLLEDERQNLGFDPRTRSHELTATNDDQAKKSPKRVLKMLTCDSVEREKPCWQETDLGTLESNGQSNGLAPFLAELKRELVPLLTGQQNPPT